MRDVKTPRDMSWYLVIIWLSVQQRSRLIKAAIWVHRCGQHGGKLSFINVDDKGKEQKRGCGVEEILRVVFNRNPVTAYLGSQALMWRDNWLHRASIRDGNKQPFMLHSWTWYVVFLLLH